MSSGPDASSPWWQGVVGYSLYLRSFADGNGDGVGDLPGMIEHLDHLEALGVELVWVSPFYPSPLADTGYDVADYCQVDPAYGDLGVLDELLSAAHDRGIAVVIDLVANHTSIEHPWFRSARSGRDDPHRDRYIWRDPAADGGPPNNWVSYFGGPAWTFDETTGQYYLHLFLPEQPDLNWREPTVQLAFDDIIRFWLDRGVDGFRIDVAQGIVKDAALRSNPQLADVEPGADRLAEWASFEHRHDILQPEAREVFARWKQICDGYDALLLGEVSVGDPQQFGAAIPGGGIDIGMWLETMHVEWGAVSLRAVLEGPLVSVSDPERIGWQASSLDEPRAATRFGGSDDGKQRALSLATMLTFLPGVLFLYQGEELGLEQAVVEPDQRIDPVGHDSASSRDGCRTPMPWNGRPQFGFTTSSSTWLPFAATGVHDTAESQRSHHGSWFDSYRSLFGAWKAHRSGLPTRVEWLDFPDADLLGFRRGDVVVVVNTAVHPLDTGLSGSVVYHTCDSVVCKSHSSSSPDHTLTLQGGRAMVIVARPVATAPADSSTSGDGR